MPKAGVRRRWVLDLQGIRREGSKASGFTYRKADGTAIKDEKTISRIQRLRIPPAWRDVRVAHSDSAPLQAVGVDKKGRTQYLYHLRFRQQREDAKFRRVVEFGDALPRLRRQVRADLKKPELEKERVLAAMVRLIDQGLFRIGNDKSAESELTFGLSTVHGRHVTVRGDKLAFDYVGKWRKKQQREVRDAEVAKIVAKLKRTPGDELFKFRSGNRFVDVKDRHVNEYIQKIVSTEFTAKDFRTWAGTLFCSIALANQPPATSKTDRKRKIRNAVAATAAVLGNTPAVCRSSYICPRVLHEYMEGRPFDALRRAGKGSPLTRVGLSSQEKALLRLFRETIADRRKHPRAA